jgi:hypothetical protein
MVEIVEAYRDFAAPSDARCSAAELLATVPPECLTGLRRVVLTNSAALTGARKRGRSWSRGKKAKHSEVAGLYHAAWQGQPAWIEIFVDKTLDGTPRWLLKLRLVRNLLLAFTLFHELGHHIHRVQRPEHKEPESVADDWRHRLSREYVRHEHPIAWIVLRPVARFARWWQQRARPSCPSR